MSALAEAPDRPEGAADDAEALAAELANIAGDSSGDNAPGTQLTLDAGGEKPTVSEFKLAGRSIELEGEFEKGSTTVLKVGIEWTAIEFVDKHDSETGQIVSTTRRHKGRIVSYDVES
jgi:hypothetical protein